MKQTGATICRLLSAFAVAVLLLICVRALCLPVRAESVPDGKYYIKVVVHDTNKATAVNSISSSNNSAGYLVVPTRKQDGTIGETWSVPVKAGAWDQNGGTWEYTKDNPVNGFPTHLRKVQTNSPTSTNWIKNNNNTYKSIINFKIYVSPDNNNWTEVLSYEEETKAGGNWSYTNEVGSWNYPSVFYFNYTLNGSSTKINHNGRQQAIPYGLKGWDQYRVVWGYDEIKWKDKNDVPLVKLRMDKPESYVIYLVGGFYKNKDSLIYCKPGWDLTVNFAPDPLEENQLTRAELGKDDCAWYSFTPSTNDTYFFYTDSDKDTRCEVYTTDDRSKPAYETDNGSMEMNLKGGSEYYFKVRFSADDVDGVIPFILSTKRGAYYSYLPKTEDYPARLASKQVIFNGIKWYIIEDNSINMNPAKGSVTLIAVDVVGDSRYNDSEDDFSYSGSVVQKYLDDLTANGGSFAEAAGAINRVDLKDVNVSGARLYLISKDEAERLLPDNILKCRKADGSGESSWWLRTTKYGSPSCQYINGPNESTASINSELGVRPALKLDLSAVRFSPESKTFYLCLPVTDVSLDKTSLELGTSDDAVSLTPTVAPKDICNDTVKWSVTKGGDCIKLYTDPECTKEVGTGPVKAGPVYVKGLKKGTAAITVTATNGTEISSDDKTASCDVAVVVTYPLWIGGTQVTETNRGNIPVSNGRKSGMASYDPASNILTLDGFTYQGAGYKYYVYGIARTASIYYKGEKDLTILMSGENHITPTGTMYMSYYGIVNYSSNGSTLTFAGTGSLTIDTPEGAVRGCDIGIYGQGKLVFSGGTVIAGDEYVGQGIATNVEITIESGITFLEAAGRIMAISGGKVKNDVPGTGWLTEEDKNLHRIEIHEKAEFINHYYAEEYRFEAYKKLRFPVRQYRVVFDSNGGDGSMDQLTRDEGEKITLPDCGFTPPTNKRFRSWEVSGLDSTVPAGSEVYVLKDYATNGVITVRPKWSDKPKPGILTEPVGKELDYSGAARELCSRGSADGGSMRYAIGDKDAPPTSGWSGEIPVRTDAGTYYIWFKAAGDTEDYCSDPGCTVAEIKKVKLTVTARPKTIVYGDAPANDGADYAGFVGDDTETADGVLSGGLAFDYTYKQYDDVGIYEITPKGLTAKNYDIAFDSGKLIVKPKSIKGADVKVDQRERTYDGSLQTVAVTSVSMDGLNLNGSDYEVTTGTEGKDAGAYSVLITGKGNYRDSVYREWKIAKKAVSVTAIDQMIKEGAGIRTGTDMVTLSDAVSGHSLSAVTMTVEGRRIILSGAVIQDADGSDVTGNYNITYHNGAIIVIPKISYSVTFRVENGAWDDGEGDDATADRTVTLEGHEGDKLKLEKMQIPSAGSRPKDSTFMAGIWDVEPDEKTEIKQDTVYIYTYAKKEPADVTKAPAARNLTYNEQAQELVIAGEASGGELRYALGKDLNTPPSADKYSTEIPAGTGAGTYYVWYKVFADDTHLDSPEACFAVTIDPGDSSGSPTGHEDGLTYTGEAQELVRPGTVQGGTMLYVLGKDASTPPEDSLFTEEIPKGIDAGDYYVWYRVAGDANHNDVPPACLTAVIKKAPVTPTVSITGWTYGEAANKPGVDAAGNPGNGDVRYEYSTDEGIGYTDQVPTEAGSYYVRALVAETKNYKEAVSKPLGFAIARASVTISADNKSGTYGEDLQALTYTVGGAYVAGDELGVSVTSGVKKDSDVGTYPITVSWNGNRNYDAQLDDGTYTVLKASMTATASGYTGTYDGKAHGITVNVTSGTAGGAGIAIPDAEIYYARTELTDANYEQEGSRSAVTLTDVGTATVYFYAVNKNHKPAAGKETITISKADLDTASAGNSGKPAARSGLTYNGKNQKLLSAPAKLPDGCAKMQYRMSGAASWSNSIPTAVKAGTYTMEYRYVGDKNHKNSAAFRIKASIARAKITITAQDKTGPRETSIKKLTWKVTGAYVSGDNLGIKASTTAKKTSKPGKYRISVSWNKDPNYTATLKDGTYTITDRITGAENARTKISLNAGLRAWWDGEALMVSWGKAEGAGRYDVLAAYCGKDAPRLVRGVSGKSPAVIKITRLNGKKIDRTKNIKVRVIAYRKVEGQDTRMGASIIAHVTGGRGRTSGFTNARSVTVQKDSYTLRIGKTAAIKAKTIPEIQGKKLLEENHAARYRYASDNKKVATIDENGKITAVGKGTCHIYIYAQNGTSRKVSVTVK
ncbi:MAG: hypothetical protein E7239_01965 [Sarcina sp.]|nr:hypothetical protein [Sarcina sp.]